MARAQAKPPVWRDARKLALLAQLVFVLVVGAGVWGAQVALHRSIIRQNIRFDWNFFRQPAGFQITALTWTLDLKTLRPKQFSPSDSYAEAMVAGAINTVKVATLSIALATALGVIVGIARLSRNWLTSRLALSYVEVLRNTPLLVQLFFWYSAIFLQLPNGSPGHPPLRLLGSLVTLTNASLAIGGTIVERFGRFVVDGGLQLTSEFAALVLGLAVYTSAFIADIVRGGILAVHRGQMEAARSLGLRYVQALRHVIIPQALRIIILPLGNQFLNLTKNSSLAIGIGYAELLTASYTVSSQSFRALETFTVVTGAYLAMSLVIAGILNLIRVSMKLATT